jgi:hypothetical protein
VATPDPAKVQQISKDVLAQLGNGHGHGSGGAAAGNGRGKLRGKVVALVKAAVAIAADGAVDAAEIVAFVRLLLAKSGTDTPETPTPPAA